MTATDVCVAVEKKVNNVIDLSKEMLLTEKHICGYFYSKNPSQHQVFSDRHTYAIQVVKFVKKRSLHLKYVYLLQTVFYINF